MAGFAAKTPAGKANRTINARKFPNLILGFINNPIVIP
jgi:hypothetical protein